MIVAILWREKNALNAINNVQRVSQVRASVFLVTRLDTLHCSSKTPVFITVLLTILSKTKPAQNATPTVENAKTLLKPAHNATPLRSSLLRKHALHVLATI